MKFTTYGGTVTSKDIAREKEDARQELIKKYEKQGYFRPWAIAKADLDIEDKRQQEIEKTNPIKRT